MLFMRNGFRRKTERKNLICQKSLFVHFFPDTRGFFVEIRITLQKIEAVQTFVIAFFEKQTASFEYFI